MDADGLMVWREELVEFRKKVKGGEDIVHKARIITYVNIKNPKKPKLTRLLTNSQSVADAAAKEHYAVMELLRACYNGQDNAHVLY